MNVSRPARALVFLAIILLFVAAPTNSTCTEPPKGNREYTFAVIPQGPPEVMQRVWLPFVDRLSRDTGLTIRLKLYEKMDDFEDDLKEGRVHLAYMNPVQEIMAWNAQGYIPLVRDKNMIRGAILVRKDSGVRDVGDLRGKRIALVGTNNVCSIVLRHDLRASNMIPHYVGSASNVYKGVAIGDTEAGGTLDVAFDGDNSEVKQVLHPIYTTQPLSPHPISALPSVTAEARRLITEAVVKYGKDKDTLRLLEGIWMSDPVAADYARDYKPLEQRLAK